MDLRLSGRTYIVTGGSSGLGRATAQALVQEGARVVIVSRRSEAVTQSVRQLGPAAVGVTGDLGDQDLAQRIIEVALGTYGRIDGALISGGGPPAGSVLSTTDDQWRSSYESIFLGSVRLMRAIVETCRTEGTIADAALAVVLSTSAVEVFSGLSLSNALRPGLAMLVKDLADEVGPEGMRVMGLLPGRIATDRLKQLDAATGDSESARHTASSVIPLRRYGEPEEFGRVAAFVLSPAASYLTGSLIRIDGGSTRSV